MNKFLWDEILRSLKAFFWFAVYFSVVICGVYGVVEMLK